MSLAVAGIFLCETLAYQFRIMLPSVSFSATANAVLSWKLQELKKGQVVSPNACKGRRGVAGFYACHFYVRRHCDGVPYPLSIFALRDAKVKQ